MRVYYWNDVITVVNDILFVRLFVYFDMSLHEIICFHVIRNINVIT